MPVYNSPYNIIYTKLNKSRLFLNGNGMADHLLSDWRIFFHRTTFYRQTLKNSFKFPEKEGINLGKKSNLPPKLMMRWPKIIKEVKLNLFRLIFFQNFSTTVKAMSYKFCCTKRSTKSDGSVPQPEISGMSSNVFNSERLKGKLLLNCQEPNIMQMRSGLLSIEWYT